jgi:NAD(P)-dependent dehydrogenase (short-subunit alcohol dehydrogenase family)
MQVTLAGKTAIVTGAASGIGLATVLQFLDSGAAAVIAVDSAPQPPAKLAERAAADPARLQYLPGDVTLESTALAFTDAALRRTGRIDVLVNNAGISVVKPLHEATAEDWDKVFNVNAKAVLWAARHVVPIMIRQRNGVILNTGSISGEVGITGQGVYAPSKGAIHQMTRQMAIEYALHNIRVNAVGCGTVDTPLVHRSAADSGDPDKFWTMLKTGHPIGRIASPEEVACFFTYLASDLASFFTGAILMMDGGFTAK